MKAIQLDARRPVERERIKGVEFLVAVSPYFFPDRLECDYDAHEGAYIIHFKYLDNEASAPSMRGYDNIIDVQVGVHTGRVLSVRVHVDRHDVDQVRMLIVDRVPEAIREAAKANPQAQGNYQIAVGVITEHANELVDCAARAPC
jgi:hypothetical protein